MNKNKFQQNRYRILIALFIFAITFTIVFITEKDIGITWDEIYLNDDAARIYVEWIKEAYKGILSGNFDFLSKTVIDKYFGAISDGGRINWHPPFARIIGGISWKFFTPYLGEMKAYRLPSALFFSLEAMLIFLILSRFFSISAGLLSVFSFILMPRVFAHSHIFALDTPVSAMWLLTIYAFIKGLDDEKWAIFTGFIFGLALSTKIHSALIPLSIAIWFLMTRNKRIWKNILSITLFSLPTFILSWPWLWYDTFARIFSFEDDQIGDLTSNFKVTYYLGKSLASSMPWHYVSVMFLSTIPPLILLAFFYGIYITVKKNLNFINGENKERKEKWDIALLLLSNAVIMLAVASAPGIPKYDGVRLFLPAFPFTASIAGIGFHYIIKNFFKKEWLKYLAGLLYIVFPLISLIRVHPYELSYYNILVGGIEGAKKIGLETTYWGDAFNRDFLKVIEKKYSTKKILYCGLPQKKRQLKFYYRNGLVAKSILDNATCSSDAFKNEGYYDYLVLNCRQGVFKKLEWFYYNFLKPEYNTILDGVPLISIYKSPFLFLKEAEKDFKNYKPVRITYINELTNKTISDEFLSSTINLGKIEMPKKANMMMIKTILKVPENGNYKIYSLADGDVSLYIDDNIIKSADTKNETAIFNTYLRKGFHIFKAIIERAKSRRFLICWQISDGDIEFINPQYLLPYKEYETSTLY